MKLIKTLRIHTGGVYMWCNKPVYITSGAFEIGGRISNYFTWREINKDGTLGTEYSGYGGNDFSQMTKEYSVEVLVKINKK